MSFKKNALQSLSFVLTLAWVNHAYGHHSMAEWLTDSVEEMQGEIVSVVWRNPHIRWTMKIKNEEGQDELWTMAGTSPNHLERRGLNADLLQVGQTIRVAGHFSHRRPLDFVVNSALLPNGTEILMRGLGPAVEPYWPNQSTATIGTGEWGVEEAENAEAQGLFTVWRILGAREPPRVSPHLTPYAQRIYDSWDEADNWVLRCERRGMPATMGNPYPREFVQDGDRIILKIEEHDNVRVIHMREGLDPAEQAPSRLGFSMGRWEDKNTLIVETSRINFPWYDVHGTPQTEKIVIRERFSLSDDQLRIDYQQEAIDPVVFTQPRLATQTWGSIPGIEIRPFNMDCSDDAYL